MKSERKDVLAAMTPELLAVASRDELIALIDTLTKMVICDEAHIRKLVELSGAALLEGSQS